MVQGNYTTAGTVLINQIEFMRRTSSHVVIIRLQVSPIIEKKTPNPESRTHIIVTIRTFEGALVFPIIGL